MNKTFFNNINNWDDFDNKLSSLKNKEKGDALPKLVLHFITLYESYC